MPVIICILRHVRTQAWTVCKGHNIQYNRMLFPVQYSEYYAKLAMNQSAVWRCIVSVCPIHWVLCTISNESVRCMTLHCFSVPGLKEIQAENLSKMADALDEVSIACVLHRKMCCFYQKKWQLDPLGGAYSAPTGSIYIKRKDGRVWEEMETGEHKNVE